MKPRPDRLATVSAGYQRLAREQQSNPGKSLPLELRENIIKPAEDLAKALALTAVTGTPAAVSNAGSSPGRPTSLTGTYSIIAPGQSGQLFLNPKLRHVPLFMQLLPYPSATGDYRHFVTT